MPLKVAINGFGRIGRSVLRRAHATEKYEIVAINDITDPATLAHLLKYDSVHGRFDAAVKVKDNYLHVDGRKISITAERDPAKLPWAKLGVEVVLESTGIFRDRAGATKHLNAGAKKVVISAPAIDPDVTVVQGVNFKKDYDKANHRIISNASCTTNCLAPVVRVLHEAFGIENGFMTTTHSYTKDEKILDLLHKDLRRARAAAVNMIPTSTGAAKALGLVMPEMVGRLDGISVRVPTPDVSLVDLVCVVGREVTAAEVNAAVKKAAEGDLKGILAYSEEPLVSSDYIGNPYSSIFDPEFTKTNGKLVKILSWYDNEWGYSCRTAELMGRLF